MKRVRNNAEVWEGKSIMRWKSCIASFTITLIVGVVVGSIADWRRPSFHRNEVEGLINDRVRYHQTEEFRMMKCFEELPCLTVADGEYGNVVGIERVPDGGYFLKVRWNEPRAYVSYFGRYTYRKSLRSANTYGFNEIEHKQP